ncbi:DUF6288 domain-containing protein [Akkermansiaceae bacterium]|nr:DUF6288 domain-containing protein [Akkermansiaceae bacterium]MDB4279135.1 DUF6288 domain-containing protein [bacterium]MDA7917063.1 DUF6288 domain-containing protein [Akkermansiaceae bacterium]MDB4286485.1 DUF6288 domain-containing protein [bacterium]MDB4369439.1 DUF6288 domain-containing protein [Akkermansiaceae bacterium]
MMSPHFLVSSLLSFCIGSALAAGPKGTMTLPDFTKGDPIPAGAAHDWNLGATGLRGWMFTEEMATAAARQISVTEVIKGSPADGTLKVGDVILGMAEPFSFDPRTEFGNALTLAEASNGKLPLILWRAGQQEKITLQLPVLGSYSATAPYDCFKSKLILVQASAALAKNMAKANYPRTVNPITRSLNALGLLACGNEEHLPLIRKEVEWAAGFEVESFATWYYGHVIMLLAEYTIATGDKEFMPDLRRLAMESAEGQSVVGSWGHRFVGTDHRLMGYGMMNAPGVPLTSALVMARAAGVQDAKIDLAIERSVTLLKFYAGKGSIPYGDHTPWMETHDDNGKCGMAAVLFSLLDEPEAEEFFSRMGVTSHGAERDMGHTGNFLNILWSLPSVSKSGPHATGAWMREFGAWYFDLARRSDGTFLHQGQPQMKNDRFALWDCTGAYLLAYAMPLKKIYLTGKRPSKIPQLDAEAAQKLIADGQGWTRENRKGTFDGLSDEQLFAKLGSWSPVVRERAAISLGKRKNNSVPTLIKMLSSSRLEERYGASQALALIKEPRGNAVPALRKNLKHDDLWLRVESAEALASIGQPAMVALPELLTMLAKGPTSTDPRGMEQRYLSFAIFNKMLKGSLEKVDQKLLREAIVAGLKNEDGSARGAISAVYQKLTYEQVKPLLPAILEAISTPAPSGVMFGGKVRIAGVDLLAKHRIREGLPLTIEAMAIDKWGKGGRIPQCLRIFEKYGAGAKPFLPRLRQLEKEFETYNGKGGFQKYIDQLQGVIKKIESSPGTIELRSIN